MTRRLRGAPRLGRGGIVMVGPFPPPVMGMAVAVQELAGLLEARVRVIKVDLAVRRTQRGLSYHLRRAGRLALATGRLLRLRPRVQTLYVACNAGHGMWYTTALLCAARLLRYDVLLHHHAYSYVGRAVPRFKVLLRLAGRRCLHLVYCDRMRDDLRRNYPRVGAVELLSIAYALGRPQARQPCRNGQLAVGHLSNLSAAKGLGRVAETVEQATRAGVDLRLVLAGPVASPGERPLLDDVLARLGPRVDYRGPVQACEKQTFLDDIDVFLLPSRYDNESFALVVWEAMARGRPTIAFRAGCLTPESVRGGGLVLEPDEDFAGRATELLRSWAADPQRLAEAAKAAVASAARVRSEAFRHVERLSSMTAPCETRRAGAQADSFLAALAQGGRGQAGRRSS